MRAGGLCRTKSARAGLGGAVLVSLLVVQAGAAAAATPPAPPPPLATPTITTAASKSVPVGGSITDVAILTGATAKPTGTITFSLYDVSDPKCTGTPVFSQAVPVGLPTTSPAYTPAKAGTYNWIASYSGDSANAKASGKCGDFGGTVSVTALTPTVTTVASASVGVGGRINDSAVLSGAYKPSGTVTFKLYADPACATPPVFTSTVPETTPTVSGAFTTTAPGTYRWVATYNGDVANTAASSQCTDPTETVVVTGAGAAKPPTAAPTQPSTCDPAKMAAALVNSVVGTLTGVPTPFKATCSAGVRIVLRAKEIRPGKPGFPRGDGFTTIANTLTHSTSTGQIGFSFNAQGVALRNYATSHATSLIVFAIVHVRPDRSRLSSETLQIFNLR